jgi:hypothetical protein
LADQYNVAEESDEVINNNNEPDENVPATNNELQVRTATFTTDGGPHVEPDYPAPSAEEGNDTLFINTIKSSSQNGTFPLPYNPFDVRRLMSNSKPAVEVTSEDGVPAPYYPVPINHPASSECCTHFQ